MAQLEKDLRIKILAQHQAAFDRIGFDLRVDGNDLTIFTEGMQEPRRFVGKALDLTWVENVLYPDCLKLDTLRGSMQAGSR